MKLRRTRIKKATKATGAVEYEAQYKYGLWWRNFCEDSFPSCIDARNAYLTWPGFPNRSKESAKSLIDYYVKEFNQWNAMDLQNKVVKTEYEDYP